MRRLLFTALLIGTGLAIVWPVWEFLMFFMPQIAKEEGFDRFLSTGGILTLVYVYGMIVLVYLRKPMRYLWRQSIVGPLVGLFIVLYLTVFNKWR